MNQDQRYLLKFDDTDKIMKFPIYSKYRSVPTAENTIMWKNVRCTSVLNDFNSPMSFR